MFSRMKQTIMEKTGKTKGTPLPKELDEAINYASDWDARDRSIIKAINEIIEPWKKCEKENNLIANLEKLDSIESCDMGPSADKLRAYLQGRVVVQKEQSLKIQKIFEDKLKEFAKTELRALLEEAARLKSSRLNRDAAFADNEKKKKPETKTIFTAADKDFKEKLKSATEKYARIPELENNHRRIIKEALQELSNVYE